MRARTSSAGVVAGGGIDINAASLLLRGSAAETFGGDGGELDLLAAGASVSMASAWSSVPTLRPTSTARWSGVDGFGRHQPQRARPARRGLEIGGLLSLASGGIGGDGGSFDVSAGRDLIFTASLNNSGTDYRGDVLGTAGRAITLNGVILSRA